MSLGFGAGVDEGDVFPMCEEVGGWFGMSCLFCIQEGRGERGGWNELLWVVGRWVGGEIGKGVSLSSWSGCG